VRNPFHEIIQDTLCASLLYSSSCSWPFTKIISFTQTTAPRIHSNHAIIIGSVQNAQTAVKHTKISPTIFYWGTLVVLITTQNPHATSYIVPMSSAWWLGNRCMLDLDAISQSTISLIRTKELVLNLPSFQHGQAANTLASMTDSPEILIVQPGGGPKTSRG
jgi:flavin reductase (DIM6/NTAB) family NADH-FMN oxidoreductase RutF